MTTTRSEVSATTPRSCVISMMAVPVFSFSSSIRSRICAWMVTSSAVVGSSAISTCGLQAERHGDHDALAHAAGELVRILVEPAPGIGDAHQVEHLARALARRRHDTPRWRTTLSAICVPMVSTGLRLVIGSWKIIEMRWPRRRASPLRTAS